MYDRDTWLSINFVPGRDNSDTDLASRLINFRTEWALPMQIFENLVFKFGCPSVHLFAPRLNKMLNRYLAWCPDPFYIEVDAFFLNWTHEYPYIYPPFNLHNRCLIKLQQDQVEKALVIFPAIRFLSGATLACATINYEQ